MMSLWKHSIYFLLIIKSLKPPPRLVKLNMLYSWLPWLPVNDTWRALHWSQSTESYLGVMYLHFLFSLRLGHNILVPLNVMSAVKCGCDILGVVYMKKEDPSARGTLDSRITFHSVSMKKFCGWLWSCCKIYNFDPQHFWLQFLGTVSTLFFGLTSYLGNRTTV